jgi:hypothetical protein
MSDRTDAPHREQSVQYAKEHQCAWGHENDQELCRATDEEHD